MPPSKRQKLVPENENDAPEAESSKEKIHSDRGEDSGDASGSDQSGSDVDSSPDTNDEIAHPKHTKSKKTLKRKRRATDTTRFGATLQSLLTTDTPTALPLSLKPSVARKRNDEKLESKAKKELQIEKKEKEEKGRVIDIIGGWGGESERALRKVAQRGVVKLFNVIQQAQVAETAVAEGLKAQRGSGKPTLPAPKLDKKQGKHKNNPIGSTAKEAVLGQNEFLNSIRSGGVVSKV